MRYLPDGFNALWLCKVVDFKFAMNLGGSKLVRCSCS